MKVALMTAFLFACSLSFATSFSEPYTGMTLDISDAFEPCEDSTYVSTCPCWYAFVDREGNLLTIEIDEDNKLQTFPEHFHKALTGAELIIERSIVCEDLEFRTLTIDGIEYTKLQVHLRAQTETGTTTLFFCDYLFVHDRFGITVSLTKREEDSDSSVDAEELMTQMLRSITFCGCD